MTEKITLLLTHSHDFYTIDRVEQAVARKGGRPYRFNTDRFPEHIKLSILMDGGEPVLSLVDGDSETVINGKDIQSVWLRKTGAPHIDKNMDAVLRKGCIKESKEVLDIFLNHLHTDAVRWMDPPSAVRKAENKLFQLNLAQSAGIRVPQTLITNSPEDLKHFYRNLNGNVVAKMLTPLTVSMSGKTPFVFTSRVKEEDLDDAGMLRYSPMAFQEYIPKDYELRIAYVDGKLLTGAVSAKKIGADTTDWRAAQTEHFQWERFTVKEAFAEKLRSFMKRIGLSFGAVDVIVQPNGEYVFLEVNPTGEWGMLERDLELPISDAIAEFLVR